jgi:hypothetical protein
LTALAASATLTAALAAALATALATSAATLGGLSAFASCLARLFGSELVGRALFVRRAAALGGDFALLLIIHRGETTLALISLATSFRHFGMLLELYVSGASTLSAAPYVDVDSWRPLRARASEAIIRKHKSRYRAKRSYQY